MADHANVSLRHAEKARGFGGRMLVVERHDDDGAFALIEHLNAPGQLLVVEPGLWRRFGNEITAESRQQFLLTPGAAPKIAHAHATRAEHELRELVGLPQPSTAERLEHPHQHLLHE